MPTTKKKIKPVIPEVLKTEEINSFQGYQIVIKTQYDLNYVSVRRKIQAFNIFKRKPRKSTPEITIDNNQYERKPIDEGYYIRKASIWDNYCKWWNNTFNKVKK